MVFIKLIHSPDETVESEYGHYSLRYPVTQQKRLSLLVIHNFGAIIGTFFRALMSLPSFESTKSLSSLVICAMIGDRVCLERRRQKRSQAQFSADCGIPLRTYKTI